MVQQIQQAKIINIEDLKHSKIRLPQSLYHAAGLLRHKRKALERHLAKVRREWDSRQ